VAVSGDRALIGAGLDDESGTSAGAVYVFERQADGSWAQATKLTADDAAAGDEFGRSVALSGSRVLVGAVKNDGANEDAGAAYVFERQADGSWTQVATLTAADAAESDWFGNAVALQDGRALVGAFFDDVDTGAAYVFDRQADGSWAQTAKLTAADARARKNGRTRTQALPARSMVTTNPCEIVARQARKPQMSNFGMHKPVHETTSHHRTCANTRADRDVDKVVEP
jgi:ketosteroid isomerase-like protein